MKAPAIAEVRRMDVQRRISSAGLRSTPPPMPVSPDNRPTMPPIPIDPTLGIRGLSLAKLSGSTTVPQIR